MSSNIRQEDGEAERPPTPVNMADLNMEVQAEVPELPAAVIVDGHQRENDPTDENPGHVIEVATIVAPVAVTAVPAFQARPQVTLSSVGEPTAQDPNVGGTDDSSLMFGTASEAVARYRNVTVVKDSTDTDLGIDVYQDEETADMKIARIEAEGVLHESPLRVGDKIVSINSKSCFEMNAQTANNLLRQLVGPVTIVALSGEGAENNLVETMVQKPSVSSKVGIHLRRNTRGSLEVAAIPSDGLLRQSLLNEGDRLLSINGTPCERLEASEATRLILSSPKVVVLLTEMQHSTGVVLATGSGSQDSIMELTATAIANGEACSTIDYNDDARRIQTHMCFCMAMILISIALVSITVFAVLRK